MSVGMKIIDFIARHLTMPFLRAWRVLFSKSKFVLEKEGIVMINGPKEIRIADVSTPGFFSLSLDLSALPDSDVLTVLVYWKWGDKKLTPYLAHTYEAMSSRAVFTLDEFYAPHGVVVAVKLNAGMGTDAKYFYYVR